MTVPTACVIGWPVSHSRSPIIHRYWLRTLGIDGDYVAHAVPPERIEAFLASFAESGFIGGNVTVPHKEAAFAAAHECDPVASALGAVNTIWLDGGRLLGSNTDAHGFLANLDDGAPGWSERGGKAVVLGAGGAARAVVWALRQRGFDVVIVNRTRERAEDLARRFVRVGVDDWTALPRQLANAAILVNTTSLGMTGQPPLELDLASLPDHAVVNDVVYVPIETPFLAAARARGLAAVDGLGMLLHQAVPGFERWFGRRPAVTPELRDLVVADIQAH
ncbi:MAG: shikimate dehydrogenase [Bauldia sp.]